MSNVWLKMKVWTKIGIFFLLAVYALFFIWFNSSNAAKFWWWFGHDDPMPVLWLTVFAFLTGVIGTILLRTTFKTIRQFREMRNRSASEQLAKEVAEMKAKEARAAAMRTKPAAEEGV